MWTTILAFLTKISGSTIGLLTGINFGSVFSSIGTFFVTVWNSILKYPFQWLALVLVLSNIFMLYEWRSTNANLVKEKASHIKDITDFKTAQVIANAKAEAIRAALKKESKADAEQADASYSTLLVKYHASLLRYSASQGGTKQSSDHQLPTTQSGNGPSTSSELPISITISGSDAEICAINTARLQAVHDWALALPKEVSP